VKIVVAIALCGLSLGLPWVGSVPGYRTDARVFLIAAIAFLAYALARRANDPDAAHKAVTGAVVALATILALGLRSIDLTALVVTVGTIVLLMSDRFAARRT
jgi:hypothetical protein